MKKLLVLALALVMAFSATLSISAATDDLTLQNSSAEVKVTINGNTIHQYSVDLEFGTLAFSTTVNSVWDTENYTYNMSSGSGWTCADGADQIKVVNHSDLPVAYSISASVSEEGKKLGDLSIAVENADGQIDACRVGDVKGSKNAVATVSVSGSPSKSFVADARLGTVTIAISKVSQ